MKIKVNFSNLKNHQNFLFIVRLIEEFLQKKGYLKIDLPVLSPFLIPESYLEVFETEFRYFDKREKLYLTPSPELFLKRLLVEGVGSCYYLGKSFRNSDPPSSLHSFEFTMLEFYKVKANYMDIANELLEMLRYINKELKTQNSKLKTKTKNQKLKNQNLKLNLDKWEKISVVEAFEKYADIFEKELFDHQLFLQKARKKGYQVEKFSYEEVWSQIYVSEIEPHLGKNGYPTLIYDYPKEFAALAKLNPDGKTAQRFEFYINGIELGDCYTELADWKEQEERFLKEDKQRKKLGKINHPIDKGFIQALKYGLPPCAGIAIGVERLAMVFLGFDSIDKLKVIDIIL
jgi:elongation factor P--(R)-beta-lysine ligase